MRISQGVAGMLDGTRFELNYMTSDAPQELAIADLVAADLQRCGIGVSVQAQAATHFSRPDHPADCLGVSSTWLNLPGRWKTSLLAISI